MEMVVLVKSQWRIRIMERIVEVETQELRDVRIRKTAEPVHGNTTRDKKTSDIRLPRRGYEK